MGARVLLQTANDKDIDAMPKNPCASMQSFEYLFCEQAVDSRDAGQLFHTSLAYALQTTEMIEQLPAPFWSHSRDVFER